MKKRLIFLFFILFLCITQVQAIGLRGSTLKEEIIFKPNVENTFYFSIVPFYQHPIDVRIFVEDDKKDGTETELAQYFELSRTYIQNLKLNQEPFFTVHMKLPEMITEPGTHTVRVGIQEVMPNSGGISVTTGVYALFFIQVPFNGKYLKYSVVADGVNAGDPIHAKVHLENLGNEKITSVQAKLELMTLQNTSLHSVQTEVVSLGSREYKAVETDIATHDVMPGTYKLRTTVTYDGIQEYSEQEIKIGELQFIVINETKEIVRGKLNELEIVAESQWADRIDNVYADVEIEGQKPIKTYSNTFEGFERKSLKGFFDASEIKTGLYDTVIRLHYQGKTTDKEVKILVREQPLFELAKGSLSSANVLFFLIIAILLTINILLFIIVIKKKEEHENQK
ncbi:MAG TPA: hypothetical protein VKE88_00755 [Candidatus Nanoarchaeia archaeon]|nr:hypothetical protein [Candidatus Nanoarchaeia archaeon]